MRRRVTGIVAGIGLLVPGAAGAAAVRQQVSAAFTTPAPGAPTGLTVAATYAGRYALRNVDDGLPPGSQIRSDAIPACKANVLEIMVLGSSACPHGSVVGGGTVTLNFGLPGLTAFKTKLTLINAGGAILFLGQVPVLGIGLVERGVIVGTTIEIKIPPLPGDGPEGATVDSESFTITRSSGLLVTPAACTPSNAWTFTRAHTYGDGVTQTVQVPLPCDA